MNPAATREAVQPLARGYVEYLNPLGLVVREILRLANQASAIQGEGKSRDIDLGVVRCGWGISRPDQPEEKEKADAGCDAPRNEPLFRRPIHAVQSFDVLDAMDTCERYTSDEAALNRLIERGLASEPQSEK
jgi:hypothetical protein